MKEELPSIFVTDGWETDNNAKLVGVAVPSSVKTLQAPKKITFYGKTINWIPSNAANLQEFEAPNCTQVSRDVLKGYTALTTASLSALTTINNQTTQNSPGGTFYGCTSLNSVSLPALSTIRDYCSYNGPCGMFYGCTGLTSISLPVLTSLSSLGIGEGSSCGAFYNCTGLTSISLPELTTITCGPDGYFSRGTCGAFYNCTGLTSVSLPSLITITRASTTNSGSGSGTFYNCTGLTSVSLPSLTVCNDDNSSLGTFGNCTSLETVQLGSVGHAVTTLGAYMFKGCTQSNLTITVYTTGGASLANEPWGATNATIIYETA